MFQSRRGRRGRIGLLPRLILLLSILALGTAIGAWRWLTTSLPVTEGEIKVLGLSQPVTITRDEHGIPFIRAETEADAYFALGYAHAQDRLWQMDLQRRIASGRLAEIAGRAGLNNDRFFRVLGIQAKAESSYDQLDEPTRLILAAYAAGVNAHIASLDFLRQPPLEFLLAGIRPKPWRPSDTLLWPRLMALQLAGNWRDELMNLKLIQRLGPQRAQELTSMILPPEPLAALEFPAHALAWPEASIPRLASNMWAVAGERSATGSPLLANDPHLSFQAPILWYLARLEAPNLSVQGGTVPGSPFVLLGQNKQVAWGFTSSHSDTMDLFVETPDPGNPANYLTPGGPRPFEVRRETIEVKGEPDLHLDVRETHHGPVISDVLSAKEAPKDIVLSLAATALNPADGTAQALRKMSQAGDGDSFRQAAAEFQAPSQYIAFAASDGQIGLMHVGLIPLRSGNASPDLPRPGDDGKADWTGFIPVAQLPQRINPPDGVVANANNRLAGEDFPHHLASQWPDALRAERLAELLAAKQSHGPDDMSAYQMDSLSMAFLHLKPFLMTVEEASPQGKKVIAILKDWDGSMARDLVEPTLFSAWAEEIQRALFADEMRKRPEDPEEPISLFDAWSSSLKPLLLEKALSGEGDWCDDESTRDHRESCQEIMARALDESLRRMKRELGSDMTQWRWKNAHRAKFPHGILERLPVPESWVAPQIETDGDGSSLNRGSFSFGNFRHVHGAGLRAVYDVKNPAASRFVIATGQSGNPLSSHYDDLLETWREGGYLRLDGQNKEGELVLWPVQTGKQDE